MWYGSPVQPSVQRLFGDSSLVASLAVGLVLYVTLILIVVLSAAIRLSKFNVSFHIASAVLLLQSAFRTQHPVSSIALCCHLSQ